MLTFLLSFAMILTSINIPAMTAAAASTTLSYYEGNGTIESATGAFSFSYPKVNGEALDDAGDQSALFTGKYEILIKKGNSWEDINTALTRSTSGDIWSENTWNDDFWVSGDWSNWGLNFWFHENQTIRFRSLSDESDYLDYELVYTGSSWSDKSYEYNGTTITSLKFAQDVMDTVPGTGGAVKFNSINVYDADGKTAVTGVELQNASKLSFYEKVGTTGGFVPLGEGHYKWDNTYGWDDGGTGDTGDDDGYWFNPIEETLTIRVALKDCPSIYADMTFLIDTAGEPKGTEYDFSNPDNAQKDQPDPGTQKDGYELIWSDEFDEDGLDLSKWAYQLGDGTDYSVPGWGNNELESYTSNSKNLGVNEDLNNDNERDGLLRITASYEDSPYKYKNESAKNYTSARIRTATNTQALFTTTYGYVEARMSLPNTKGAWPAFWMLPQNTNIYGAWPVSGEIDIMETTGVKGNTACSTLHYGAPDHVYRGSGYVELPNGNDNTQFHTYAVDWEPGKMTFYYDGKPIYTRTDWKSGKSGASDSLTFDAPFDQPYHIILNLAVDSGTFGGAENKARFHDNINMYVDYVRVYQRENGYDDSVSRDESGSFKDDWKSYEGKNQIAELSSGSLDSASVVGDLEAQASSAADMNGKWYLATTEGGNATMKSATVNGKDFAEVDISAAGSQVHSVQLIGHYDAKEGYLYRVSFDAYAEGALVGTSVNSDSSKCAGEWDKFGILSVPLADKVQTYSYLITQEENYNRCRIEFNLGTVGTGKIYIGNVKVQIVDPNELNAESERTARSNGDIIYNGTFDQGVGRTAYWRADEGTVMEVPRYTVQKVSDKDVSVLDVASKTNYEDIDDGIKYYERRAEISSASGTERIWQPDLTMPKGDYTLTFDIYSQYETAIMASIYTTNGEKLDTQVKNTNIEYEGNSVNTLKTYTWKFQTDSDLTNAALVFTFGDGFPVQIDNVTLIDEDLKAEVDENPITPDKQLSQNNADGGNFTWNGADGIASNITSSGSNWYSPMLISDKFKVTEGYTYKLHFKYKMDGMTEAKYMLQNDGSWEVIYGNGNDPLVLSNSGAGEDGYCTLDQEFPVTMTKDAVQLKIGFGESGASGSASFEIKDLSLTVVGPTSTGGGDAEEMPKESIEIEYDLDDANGATAMNPNPLGYAKRGDTITLKEPSRKAGYTFLGWTDTKDGTDYKNEYTGTGDVMKFYAHWADPTDTAEVKIEEEPQDGAYEQDEQPAKLTVKASSDDLLPLTYQWYSTPESGTEGEPIPGATDASYTPDTSAQGIMYYYCIVTNTNTYAPSGKQVKTKQSREAMVTVGAVLPAVTIDPSGAQRIPVGQEIELKAIVHGAPQDANITYQWKQSQTGQTNSGIAMEGETGQTLKLKKDEVTRGYYAVEATINDQEPIKSLFTEVWFVQSEAAKPVFKNASETLAKTVTVEVGKTAKLDGEADVSDGGTLTYQWYRSSSPNTDGEAIEGATNATYNAPASEAGTYYYYVVATNTNKSAYVETATATSAVWTVVVTDAKQPDAQKVNAARPIAAVTRSAEKVEYLGTATLTAAASVSDGGTLSYQWYKNTTNSTATGTAIAGATADTYSVPTTALGMVYYYVKVTNTNNKVNGVKTATADSNIVSVNVVKATNPLLGTPSVVTKAIGKAFTLSTGAIGATTFKSSKTKVAKINKTTGKVTMKALGKTKITVTAAGNEFYNGATKTITLKVTPKKVKIKSAKSPSSKTIVVTWKKDAKKATGYEVQYSLKKNFKGASKVTIKKVKTVKTAIKKKLKGGKKYYVRVRAYKKDGGKIYGPWSKTKNLKVKK